MFNFNPSNPKAIAALIGTLALGAGPGEAAELRSEIGAAAPQISLPHEFRLANLNSGMTHEQRALFTSLVDRVNRGLHDGSFGLNELRSLAPYRSQFTSLSGDCGTVLEKVAINEDETIASRLTALMLLDDLRSPRVLHTCISILESTTRSADLRDLAITSLVDYAVPDSSPRGLIQALRTCHDDHTEKILNQILYLTYRNLHVDKPAYGQALSIVASKSSETFHVRLNALETLANVVAKGELGRDILLPPLATLEKDVSRKDIDDQQRLSVVRLLIQPEKAAQWFERNLLHATSFDTAFRAIDWLRNADLISDEIRAEVLKKMLRRSFEDPILLSGSVSPILTQLIPLDSKGSQEILQSMAQISRSNKEGVQGWISTMEALSSLKAESVAGAAIETLGVHKFFHEDSDRRFFEILSSGKWPQAVPGLLSMTNQLSQDVLSSNIFHTTLVRALGACAVHAEPAQQDAVRNQFLAMIKGAESAGNSKVAGLLLETIGPIHNPTSMATAVALSVDPDLLWSSAVGLARANAKEGIPLYREVLDQFATNSSQFPHATVASIAKVLVTHDRIATEPLLLRVCDRLSTVSSDSEGKFLTLLAEYDSVRSRNALASRFDDAIESKVDFSQPIFKVAATVIERPEIASRFYSLLKHQRAISQETEKFFFHEVGTKAQIVKFIAGLDQASQLAKQGSGQAEEYTEAAIMYRSALQAGILHPFRYTPEDLAYIVEMHKPGQLRNAKNVVIVFSPHAGDVRMNSLNQTLREFRGQDYSVLLLESAGLEQSKIKIDGALGFDTCIARARELLSVCEKNTAAIGVWQAHSIDTMMQFGAARGKVDFDNGSLSLANEKIAKTLGFDTLFRAGARLIAIGCEAGKRESTTIDRSWRGGTAGDNVCSMLSRIVPQAAGCEAANWTITDARPIFDRKGNFTGYKFD